MLRQLNRHLWVAEQPQKYFGLEVGTRMTVVVLTGSRLVLISPIKIDRELQEQLDRLGEVTFIIAPNLFHYLYVEECQQVYPEAKLIAAPGLETKTNLAIDDIFFQAEVDFDRELEYLLFVGFRVFIPPQIATVNEVVFFHPNSKSLILTDTAFNFDRSFPLATQLAARVIGSYQQLRPSRLEKVAINRDKARNSVQKILAWDFQRVIMAHGSIAENNAKEQLAAGYRWLLA